MIQPLERRHHVERSDFAVEDETSQSTVPNPRVSEDDEPASTEGRPMARKSTTGTGIDRTRRSCGPSTAALLSALLALLSPKKLVQAWGSSSSGYSESDYGRYGNGFTREWLYDGSALSFEVLGCVWGMVDDSEEVGCLQDGSEDGTTNWYMMANCRRPQVAFSVYSDSRSGSSGCSSDSFVGSFVTTVGVSEVLSMLQSYDANFVSYDDGYSYDQLPTCSQGQNGYLGMDCTDGQFTINYFNDQYCMARTGKTYNKLSNINKMLGTYESCTTSYDEGGASLISNLVYYSSPCTSADYSLCGDDYNFNARSNGVSSPSSGIPKSWTSGLASGGHQTWVTKLKYVIGGLFLLASFIMFTGILFTNRRRRRAMMMRKYRQAKKAKKDKGRDSASRKSRSGSKRRSKSKSRDKVSDGVYT